MPVTKTAKRALRGSKNKAEVNKVLINRLEIAIRMAKKTKASEKILSAMSLADRAAKKRIVHKNKAARVKSRLSKLLTKKNIATKSSKKSSKKQST